MLRLRRIEIRQFVCFDRLILEPSTDPDRPLTVIRAENASGKTTLFHAVAWGMYGEEGLGSDPRSYSLHPVWWTPDESGIETRVAIEFETDGTTRHHPTASATTTVYELVRSVTTIGRPTARDDRPDFRRIQPRARLMVRGAGGTWSPHTMGVDVVIGELLPIDLRDFFLMNADAVTDFVGGAENKFVGHPAVVKKTTEAVDSLLAIGVFRDASKRVADLARSFARQATTAVGAADLNELQADLDHLRAQEKELDGKISDQRTQKRELEGRRGRAQDRLETLLRADGASVELRANRESNDRRLHRALQQRKTTLSGLSGDLEAASLLASLLGGPLARTYALLQPRYERGQIPLRHATYVRDLLESGVCVCGQDLASDGPERRRVQGRISESLLLERRADYLGHLHDTTRSMFPHIDSTEWEDGNRERAAVLAHLSQEITDCELMKEEIATKLKVHSEEQIQLTQEEIEALDTQLSTLAKHLTLNEAEIEPLRKEIESLAKRINDRQRGERAAANMHKAKEVSDVVVQVLDRAYGRIQKDQVDELSQRMDRLFARMAANVSDRDFDSGQSKKASLQVIAQVGIRPVEGEAEKYEIFARNSRGRIMPTIAINGASRRVIALAFVLALCIESRTYAPLIADSLLNFLSGTVRRNTLRVTAEHSSQPILLLTGSDLEAQSEIATIEQYAGATYTLTAQWHAAGAEGGGDVVRRTDPRRVSIACVCGPRQYCDVCERMEQAETAGWERQELGQLA